MPWQATTRRNVRTSAQLLAYCLLLGTIFCIHAPALDPNKRLTQYAHSAWRTQDGSFSGDPQVIAQTSDGYLWIGTTLGLVRFDGVRFVSWEPPAGQRILDPRIFSLLADRDGSLWIGTGFSLSHWVNGSLINYPQLTGRVEDLTQDANGSIWLVRTQINDNLGGPICRIDSNVPKCFGPADGLTIPYPVRTARSESGDLWVAGSWPHGYSELYRWKPGSPPAYIKQGARFLDGSSAFKASSEEKGGSIWAAMEDPQAPLALDRLQDGKWQAQSFPDIPIKNSDVMALFVDRNDALWIATSHHGIYRSKGGVSEHFGRNDGLTSDAVGQLFQDAEGSVWVLTSAGLDSFRDLHVTSYSMREGLSAEGPGALVAAKNGDVWIANFQAIDHVHDNQLSAVRPHDGLPGDNVTTVFEDHAGLLWLGIDSGLWVYNGSAFRAVLHPDKTQLGTIFSIAEDSQNNIWVLAAHNLDRIENFQVKAETTSTEINNAYVLASNPQGGVVLGVNNGDLLFYRDGTTQIFPSNESGNTAQIRDLFVENDGSVWATNVEELVRLKDGKRQNLSLRNGLPCEEIFALVKDASDAIWLYTKCGIVEITRSELDRWWAKPDSRITYRLIDEADGAQPGLTSLKPQAARTSDGRLWFVNTRILQMFDPLHFQSNPVRPPVIIEDVVADRRTYVPTPQLSLPALTNEIQIDYAGLSFIAPQKVRFRYKLDGHDTQWQEPGTRRQAFYSDLPPGNYHFHVIACNNDGLWNETGAVLDFIVQPAVYQTGWFKVTLLLCTLVLAWLLFRLRIRQLTSQIQQRVAERLGERERIARELHDTLLQGFHGLLLRFQVVNQLISKEEKAHEIMEDAMNRADLLMSESRERIRDLRSPTGAIVTLTDALSIVGEERRSAESIGFRLVIEGAQRELNPVIRDEMYLIGREAIVNSFIHSQGSMVEVEINFDKSGIRLRIRDDGKGIPEEIVSSGGTSGHWGLSGMIERAKKIGGQIRIWNRSGAGTEVELKVPGGIAYARESKPSLWSRIRASLGL